MPDNDAKLHAPKPESACRCNLPSLAWARYEIVMAISMEVLKRDCRQRTGHDDGRKRTILIKDTLSGHADLPSLITSIMSSFALFSLIRVFSFLLPTPCYVYARWRATFLFFTQQTNCCSSVLRRIQIRILIENWNISQRTDSTVRSDQRRESIAVCCFFYSKKIVPIVAYTECSMCNFIRAF